MGVLMRGCRKSRYRPIEATGLADAFVGPQIHLLVFYGAPQPLDEQVVVTAALAVHADCDAIAQAAPSEFLRVNCAPWSVLKISGVP